MTLTKIIPSHYVLALSTGYIDQLTLKEQQEIAKVMDNVARHFGSQTYFCEFDVDEEIAEVNDVNQFSNQLCKKITFTS